MTKQYNITIGGLFSVFTNDSTATFDKSQLENLHAFLLAINEVNNQTNILPHHHVNFVARTSFTTKTISTIENTLDLIRNKVDGVVGSLDNFRTNAVNQYLNDVAIVQSHSMAQGMVLQHLLCNEFEVKRFVSVISSDLAGQKFNIESHDETYCHLDVPFKFFADAVTTDFSDFITNCIATEQKIVVVYLPPLQAAMFLEQAYSMGFLQKGVQIFTDHAAIKPEIYTGFSHDAPVETIMNGIISIDFWPEYFIYRKEGQKFMEAWRNQKSTTTDCSSKIDISGNYYLSPANDIQFPLSCVGLNFSQYYTSGTNINGYAPYTYDATYLLLRGLSDLLYNHTDMSLEDLHFLIINNTVFEGATGLIDIFEGMPNFANYGQGGREVGHFYKVLNFNSIEYRKNKHNAFIQVGSWTVENGYKSLCSDKISCTYELTFNTVGNQRPRSLPSYADSYYPNVIKLGGLFSPFREEDGSVNWDQVENMNSFLMAVQHINNKHDGIWDTLLPNTKIVIMINGQGWDFTGGAYSMERLFEGFGGTGVNAVIGALENEPTCASNQVNIPGKVVQLHSVATAAELGDGSIYQYKVQTSPIDTYQGMTIQNILCGAPFFTTKISIFASYDYVGTKSVTELSDGTYCTLRILSIIFINGLNLDDYSKQLREAQSGGATYYVFFLPPYTTARIIEQGYQKGIFHSEMQFFGTNLNTNNQTIQYFKNKDMIPTYMKGFIGFEWYPDYAFFENSGKQFMKQWKSMNSTAYEIINGTKKCLKTKDDDGRFLLYQSATNTKLCSGLDYSSYNIDGSSFRSKHVLQTYDATIAMALGFDLLVKRNESFNGDKLLVEIMSNVSFDGASGYIDLFEGMPMYGMYGRGDREVGHYYKVLNYDKNSPNSFSLSKIWTVENGLSSCPAVLDCAPLVFNSILSANILPPSDTNPDIIVTMNNGVIGTLYTIGALAGIMVLFFLATVVKYRKTNILKASQLPLLYIVLVGEFFGAIKVLIAASPITTDTCITGLWFAHLGFFMVFTTLMLKCWRVNRLLNNKSLKKIKISTMFLLQIIAGIMSVVIIFLFLLTFVGRPHLSYITDTVSNQLTKYPYCAYNYPQFQIFLYVAEILLLFYGVYISWSIKDVPDAINESQYIVSAMGLIAILSYMAFPFVISSPPWIVQLIAAFGFLVAVICTTLLVFYPKAIVVLTGRDLNMKSMQIERRNDKHHDKNKISPKLPQYLHDELITSSDLIQTQEGSSSVMVADESLRRNSISGFNFITRNQNAVHNYDVPLLKDIKGNAQQKVQFIDGKVKEWIKLKQLADQMILMAGEGRSSGSSYNSSSGYADSSYNDKGSVQQ